MREVWYGRIANDDGGCHDVGYPPNNGIEQTNGGRTWMTPFAAHPGCYLYRKTAFDKRYHLW